MGVFKLSKTSEVLSYYRMREKTTNYLQVPKKGIDNGIGGKCYEVEVVARIVGRVTGVKKAGHCDLIWHGRHHEIKIGSGQLGTLTYKTDGTPIEHIKKMIFLFTVPSISIRLILYYKRTLYRMIYFYKD